MTLTAGTRLGSYEIGAPLGRGGVGEVYRAWDPRLEREVALKILRERTEIDPDRVWRFVAEARAASALNHPNILTVFDAAVDGATRRDRRAIPVLPEVALRLGRSGRRGNAERDDHRPEPNLIAVGQRGGRGDAFSAQVRAVLAPEIFDCRV